MPFEAFPRGDPLLQSQVFYAYRSIDFKANLVFEPEFGSMAIRKIPFFFLVQMMHLMLISAARSARWSKDCCLSPNGKSDTVELDFSSCCQPSKLVALDPLSRSALEVALNTRLIHRFCRNYGGVSYL